MLRGRRPGLRVGVPDTEATLTPTCWCLSPVILQGGSLWRHEASQHSSASSAKEEHRR